MKKTCFLFSYLLLGSTVFGQTLNTTQTKEKKAISSTPTDTKTIPLSETKPAEKAPVSRNQKTTKKAIVSKEVQQIKTKKEDE